MRTSAKLIHQLLKEFEDVFAGIGCFCGTFSLKVKLDSKSYQVLPRCVTYALNKSFKEGLEQLQQQYIITTLGMGEIAVVQQFHTGTRAEWKGQTLP